MKHVLSILTIMVTLSFLVHANPAVIPTYTWDPGPWSDCSVACGGCTQTRTVVCMDASGQPVVDQLCTDPRPATSQSCNNDPCPTYSWEPVRRLLTAARATDLAADRNLEGRWLLELGRRLPTLRIVRSARCANLALRHSVGRV